METLTILAVSSYLRVRVIESTRAQQLQAFQPDVACAVPVGIDREATLLTAELGLRLPVPLFRVTALIASPGGIPRVNPDQWNAGQRGLVGEERPKLREGPAMQLRPFPLSGPCPRPNAFEVFDGYRPICALRGLDYAFGNYVVLVGGESSFLQAPLLQEPLGGLGALALELPPQGEVAMANLVQAPAVRV